MQPTAEGGVPLPPVKATQFHVHSGAWTKKGMGCFRGGEGVGGDEDFFNCCFVLAFIGA